MGYLKVCQTLRFRCEELNSFHLTRAPLKYLIMGSRALLYTFFDACSRTLLCGGALEKNRSRRDLPPTRW